MPTKDALRKHLFEQARVPLVWYPSYRHAKSREKLARLGVTWTEDAVPIVEKPERFLILVAGGDGGLQACGISTILAHAVTKKVVLP
ncbi:MAG: hypothetical protein HY261_07970 [Chloroflexi bacterium]|nr:hypothetical protein [Chloroflexota bacterium]